MGARASIPHKKRALPLEWARHRKAVIWANRVHPRRLKASRCLRKRWGRRANRVSQYRRQHQGVERQGDNAAQRREHDRTGGKLLVMVEADGKHRRDGHAGAGLENQHDHRHHTGDTQQCERSQCCRRDNEQPQAQREKEILILQQLFQVAGRDGPDLKVVKKRIMCYS